MTVVFYMARGALPAICTELSQRGLGKLSFALVEHASLPEERALVGTVQTLPDLVEQAQPPVTGACILLLGPEQIPTLRADNKPPLAPPKALAGLALGATCPRRLGGRTRADPDAPRRQQ